MAYTWKHETPSLIFEIYMPSRHREVVMDFMDALFYREKFAKIPLVSELVEQGHSLDRVFELCREIISGYSIYEVQGRYWSPQQNRPVDETSLVIRLIVMDTGADGDLRRQVRDRAVAICKELISARFADEVREENEIWMTVYDQTCLYRRVKL